MASYDRRIINEFADRLYNRAGTVIFTYTSVGILAGGAFYPFSKTTAIVLAVVFGFIGFLIGNEKAFWYKLQAQITLCQAKIEENTSVSELINRTEPIQIRQERQEVKSNYNKICPKCSLRHPEDVTICPECDLELVPAI